MPRELPEVAGVVGAGTMGGGIAQLAALAGIRTIVHDPVPEALERGLENVRANLARGAERGRWSEADAQAAAARLAPAAELGGLADCELVIEAAPESLEIKRELYGALSAIVAEDCVLATNTSSLPVTAIAAGATAPERVVGMHFFNPAPLMRLLEVVAGTESGERALAIARATGEAMGKVVIDAADGPGFLVNRCNRPFGLEALRLLQERVATIEQIDRICRLGGGFRMGPFELMDLVGVDVGFDVSRSFYEQSFGEPRWRPSPITARYVAAGRNGRKAGRGYYDYAAGEHRAPDPDPPPAGGGEGVVAISGELPLASELRAAAAEAGWDVRAPGAAGEQAYLIVDCGIEEDDDPGMAEGVPRAICCHDGSLAALAPGGGAVGFHALPPLPGARLVELTRGSARDEVSAERAERFFASLGRHVEWVGDGPGLVLGRIVCQVANEAAFALGEGVGSADDIDAGMLHGLNYPHGILHWADAIGLDHVLSVLDALHDELREERYRAAPELRRRVAAGHTGRASGTGFFAYDG